MSVVAGMRAEFATWTADQLRGELEDILYRQDPEAEGRYRVALMTRADDATLRAAMVERARLMERAIALGDELRER